MKKFICLMLLFSQVVFADQLWVFYHRSCHHCELFINQAYSFYPNRKLWGIKAPVPLIRLIDLSLDDANEKMAQLEEPISTTPTFVLMDDEDGMKEIGRFSGYATEREFYTQLSGLVCSATKHVRCEQPA